VVEMTKLIATVENVDEGTVHRLPGEGPTRPSEAGSASQTVSEIVTQRIVEHVQAHARQAAHAARGDYRV